MITSCVGEDDLLGEGEGAGGDLSEEAGQDQGGVKSNCCLILDTLNGHHHTNTSSFKYLTLDNLSEVKRPGKIKGESNPTAA